MLSLGALLLHAAALGGVDWAWPSAQPMPLPLAVMQTRTVDLEATPSAATPVASSDTHSAARVARHSRAATVPARSIAAAAPEADTAPVVVPQNAAVGVAQKSPVVAAGASQAASTPSDEETVPRYDTLMPPALALHYEMRRGTLVGNGDLTWHPQGDRYDMKLEAKVAGLPVLAQTSAGTIDAAGIAPTRYTDQRLRRSMTAANFQRDAAGGAGKISFSGSSAEYPLRPGTQDRLTWMIQLSAIVAADAQLAKAGSHVVLFVVGANGDGSVWSFRCVGPESLETRNGAVDSVKYMREPREPYDTTIEVWLDPRQHALPIRATQKSGPNDEGYELRLIETHPLE